MPPPLPYFKVNICPFPLPYFTSIFFAYLWSFCWPNYIATLPIFLFSTATFKYTYRAPLRRIGQEYSANVAWSTFKSLKRIQPLPVSAVFFICIQNSLERPCVTMPSWSSPLKWPDWKWLYPFQWLINRPCYVRWTFLSNSSEGVPVGQAVEKRNILEV
jgi:hypothetical protein